VALNKKITFVAGTGMQLLHTWRALVSAVGRHFQTNSLCLDPVDTKAEKANLPPIDSVNQWPLLIGQTTIPPRTMIPLGSTSETWIGATRINGFISGDYKLLVGRVSQAGWTGTTHMLFFENNIG
jgi:hypothetical protein